MNNDAPIDGVEEWLSNNKDNVKTEIYWENPESKEIIKIKTEKTREEWTRMPTQKIYKHHIKMD